MIHYMQPKFVGWLSRAIKSKIFYRSTVRDWLHSFGDRLKQMSGGCTTPNNPPPHIYAPIQRVYFLLIHPVYTLNIEYTGLIKHSKARLPFFWYVLYRKRHTWHTYRLFDPSYNNTLDGDMCDFCTHIHEISTCTRNLLFLKICSASRFVITTTILPHPITKQTAIGQIMCLALTR